MGDTAMKMGVGTRILLTIYLLLIMGVCVFIILATTNVVDYKVTEDMLYLFNTSQTTRIVAFIVCVVVIIISLILMFFGIRKGKDKLIRIREEQDGTYQVSIRTIEEIASRAYGSMMEITKSHLRAKYSHAKGGLSILSIMEVKPNVNIPELTKKVSELIKQDVEQYTGLTVAKINLNVKALSGRAMEVKPLGE